MADKYILSVTAGPTYTDQHPVPINTSTATHIASPAATTRLHVHIRDYRGLPASSPPTSAFFTAAPHARARYALRFRFTPRRPLRGADLVLGNDFDHPIRARLPPGTAQALQLVRWLVDPGLDGDVYADRPYLYGPLLSSVNVLRVGGGAGEDEAVAVMEEGAAAQGVAAREAAGIPGEAAARQKWFLAAERRAAFTFEAGTEYGCDFFNPYLDFNEFAVKLPAYGIVPGITIPVISHWDGQPLRAHALRYVLKDRATDETLFVVVFTLLPRTPPEGEGEGDAEGDAEEKAEERQAGTGTGAGDDARPQPGTGGADDDLD